MGTPVTAPLVVETLNLAKRLGISLRAEDGYVGFHPRAAMTRELADAIRACRGEVLALLAAAVSPPTAPCWNCHGVKYFARVERMTWICARCHPPSEPDTIVWHAVGPEVPRD